ncbi:helix-turn-helix protein [compost metagenome]
MFEVKIKLKEVIEKHPSNLTQKDLAKLTGIREATISDFARGSRTVINIDHLQRIANALNITDIRELIDLVEKE